jgi:hypothetical protein
MCSDTLTRVRTRFIRQNEKGVKKEWYHSTRGELLIRRAESTGDIVGIELTLERADAEEQDYVVWQKGRPAKTGAVDPGERSGRLKMSPIVTLHAVADPCVLKRAAAFVADRRRKLPHELRHFLAERLAASAGD